MPLPLAGKMPELELSGWHNGGGTFGLKVLGGLEERDRFLPLKARVEREGLDIVLPGEAGDVTVRVNVSETFGSTCPEFRSGRSPPLRPLRPLPPPQRKTSPVSALR